MSRRRNLAIRVRQTRAADFDAVIAICRRVYPFVQPWPKDQLAAHITRFPEGQLVAVAQPAEQARRPPQVGAPAERVVGMCAGFRVSWTPGIERMTYWEATGHGYFTTHEPAGPVLYAAEVMVDPEFHRLGIGKKLYLARRRVAERLGVRAIRAGGRPRHYHRYADRMGLAEYAWRVARGDIGDPTLSFQVREGFLPIGVIDNYLPGDPETKGTAVLIEWLNPDTAGPADFEARQAAYEALKRRR